jgi:hypothetical protein
MNNQKSIAFNVENLMVRGTLHLPHCDSSDQAKLPGILLIPGFADTAVGLHNMLVLLARELAKSGFAVLRFDYRGQGESDGDFRHFTLTSGLVDAKHAINFLQSQFEVDENRLGVMGFSLGGAYAAALGYEFQSAIFASVLWSPIAYVADVFHSFFSLSHKQQWEEQGWADWNGWRVGKAFSSQWEEWKPLQLFNHSEIPSLVIHGDADTEVPLTNGRAYAELGADIRIIRDGDHQYTNTAFQQMAASWTVSFFKEMNSKRAESEERI